MSNFVLTRSGSVIDFGPLDKGAWARVFSKGSWVSWIGMPEALLGSRPLSEKEAIQLTSPDVWLAESAAATFDLLVERIHDARIIVSMFDCYKYYFKLYGEKLHLKPRKIDQSDRDRLLFEILCFATFNIVVRVVPRYVTGGFWAEGHASGGNNVRLFSQRLLECLEEFLNTHEIAAVREPVLAKMSFMHKHRPGERLKATKRLACYLEAGSIEEELRIFSDSVGSAIDPRRLQIAEVIGLSHSGMILDIISKTLKTVFQK